MALYGSTVWEIRTDGSDALNSGGFAPAAAGLPTDLVATNANTTSPVVTSASYSFQAGDVGHYLFVRSGTNWYPGWYRIVSVNAGAATIDASITAVVRYAGWGSVLAPTASGCASVASPTGGTWAIDYSQASTRAFALTGVTTAGADAILLTASATKAMTGNVVRITAGTNFTAGFYAITAVTTGVSITLDRTCTTAAGAAGAVSIGGALASIGLVGSLLVANNTVFIRSGTYLVTSATTNIAGGCMTVVHPTGYISVHGYGSSRLDSTARPILRASGISSFTLINYSGDTSIWSNLELDGAGLSSGKGIWASGNNRVGYVVNCVFRNFTNNALSATGTRSAYAANCLATGCSTQPAFHSSSVNTFKNCVAINNTATGFAMASAWALDCISANNTGATSDGFNTNGNNYANFIGCVAYGNGRDGIRIEGASGHVPNCVAVSNGGYGVNVTTYAAFPAEGVALWGNTSGGIANSTLFWRNNTITLSASPFVDAANGDFRLNDTPGGGALLRSVGYPSAFPGLPLTTNFGDIGAVQTSPARSGWGV